jgi:hypothetical protein
MHIEPNQRLATFNGVSCYIYQQPRKESWCYEEWMIWSVPRQKHYNPAKALADQGRWIGSWDYCLRFDSAEAAHAHLMALPGVVPEAYYLEFQRFLAEELAELDQLEDLPH